MFHFLNPTILFALSAALIPLLIHLFNRRKFKEIKFSTVHFLKEMVRREMRNLKFRQLLLLIIRMLIILLLVLAFARPTLKSTPGFISGRSATEVIVLIDNSLSLNQLELTGNLLEHVRQWWFNMESLFQTSDRISVILAVEPLQILAEREYYSPELWAKIAKEIQPSTLQGNLNIGMIRAWEMLQASELSNQEIYLISDFQTSGMNLSELGSREEEIASGIRTYFLSVRHPTRDNISVDSAKVVNQLIEKNQTISVEAFVQNHQSDRVVNSLVSLILGDMRVAQQNVTLAPAQAKNVEFNVVVPAAGFVPGFIECENDGLLEDNRYYFNFFVPDHSSILHLVPSAGFETFLTNILKPAVDKNIFQYRKAVLTDWASLNFSEFQAVILEGFEQIPEGLANRLEQYYRQGNGVFLIPGENLSLSEINGFLRRVQIGQLVTRQGDPAGKFESANMGRVNWDHPVLQDLFQRRQDLQPVQFFAYYQVRPLSTTETVIQLQNGHPLLLESREGAGTVFLLAAPLQPQWTNLVIRGLVVPLVYRLLYYAVTRNVTQRLQLPAGQPLTHTFLSLSPPYQFTLRRPSGLEEKLTPVFRGSQVMVQNERNFEPGNYEIWQLNRLQAMYSVNHSPRESIAEFYQFSQLKEVFPASTWVREDDNFNDIIERSRYGRELWSVFLLIAILLLFVEMFLAFTGSIQAKNKVSENELWEQPVHN